MLSMIFQNFSGSGKTKKGHSLDSRNPFDFQECPRQESDLRHMD